MTNRRPRLAVAAIAILLLLVVFIVGGCARQDPTADEVVDHWASAISDLRANTSSEFVRSILADGRIDPDEVREAQLNVVQCVSDRGFHVEYVQLEDRIGMRFLEEETDQTLEAEIECYELWDGGLTPLFIAMEINPGGDNWSSLVAACLVRNELVPEGFTGRDLDELIDQDPGTVHFDGTETDEEKDQMVQDAMIAAEAAPETLLPGGRSLSSDPDVVACTIDPRT